MSSAFFLSYRRDDSAGFAGRLADALEHAFGPGSVFRDVDDIGPGEDFIHTIESQLRDVGAVLVMIGPHWLAAGADGQRRLDAKDDFVHLEIQLTLASGKPLIPLLVGGARMPVEADLPPLARRQAVVLSDARTGAVTSSAWWKVCGRYCRVQPADGCDHARAAGCWAQRARLLHYS